MGHLERGVHNVPQNPLIKVHGHPSVVIWRNSLQILSTDFKTEIFRSMSSAKWKGDPEYYKAGGKPFPEEEVEFLLIGAGASFINNF